jgi:thioredoxin-dependent peroxiredoxin
MSELNDGAALPKTLLAHRFATTRGEASLADFAGHNVVIYFYPKDSTPGCTVEGKDFSALHSEFLAADTQVVGVSRDSLKSHLNFIEKQGLTITLISDADESLCKAFDVIKEKNMYGKKVLGIERSTFLIDAKGVLRKQWRGVKVPGHAQEVLAAAKALG